MIRPPRPHPSAPRRGARGFTLIEMVVVMAALALLLSLSVPRYLDTLARGREQVLQHNLASLREAIDKFYGDNGRYPDKLEDLVARHYLRAIPHDPFLESPTWVVVAPRDSALGGVIDVRSTGQDTNGEPRRAPEAPPAPGGEGDTFAEREGGSTQVVTATVVDALPDGGREGEPAPQDKP